MAGEEGVSPHSFAVKLNVMLGLVILDCLCNGFADHFWEPKQVKLVIVLGVVPILLHLLQVLVFFMLLWHFQFGAQPFIGSLSCVNFFL